MYVYTVGKKLKTIINDTFLEQAGYANEFKHPVNQTTFFS